MKHPSQYFQAALLSLMSFYGASVNAASLGLTIENRQWNQISIPADVTGQSITTLFGDDIDISKYQDTWIVWRFDAANNTYRIVDLNDPLESNDGYWFIQDTGTQVVLTLPQDLPNETGETGPGCATTEEGCLVLPLATRSQDVTWSMIGVGINQPVHKDSFVFVSERLNECSTGCSIDEAAGLGLSSPILFWYNPATSKYDDFSGSPLVSPWQGIWFATTANTSGSTDDDYLLVPLPSLCTSQECNQVSVGSTRIKWHPLIVDVLGPDASESDTNPNPFLDIRLNITFTAPTGESVIVPGFFAGDGNGSSTGNVWRVRFAPDQAGQWAYSISFQSGSELSVKDETNTGAQLAADSASGTFTIVEQETDSPGLLAGGRLEYVDEHYLKQRDGDFWIKTGIDSPENFFGYAGFDNTQDQSGGAGTNGLVNGLHRYGPHIDDWKIGDPLFISSDSGVDSKGIIGAVNYLSSQEINSVYFLPMNLGGDGRDTHPFLDASGSTYDNTHYDVSKLFQWNIVLDYMQRKGISAHIVLAETEEGNTNWFDDGQLGVERKLYYRELVSRFAYLNGVKWNLSEESRYGTDRHLEFASYLRKLDWANHQIAVHTNLDSPGRTYDSLLGSPLFDSASIQFSPRFANLYVEFWRDATTNAGRKWVIDMDEVAPAGTGLTDTNADSLRQNVLYPTLFSGGHIEWYFGYHNLPLGGDMRTENFRTRESMFTYMRYARQFMELHLPFWTMSPNDDAMIGGQSGDQVFAKVGEVYALYLLNGAAGRTLIAPDGNYDLRWFNPRLGQFVEGSTTVSGGQIALGASPNDSSEDWVILLKRN